MTETDKTREGIVRVASGGTRVAVGGGGLVGETVLCVVAGVVRPETETETGPG